MGEECEKCGSYNTYIDIFPYALFKMATKKICSDCGHEEIIEILEDTYE